MNLRAIFGQLLNISTTDPDDARRRKLLTVILLAVTGVAAVLFLGSVIVGIPRVTSGTDIPNDLTLMFFGSLGMIVGNVVILAINRYGSGWIASGLFLILLTAIAAFSDQPEEVVDGRGLVIFAIPIIMASVISRPHASFYIAALSSVTIAILGMSIGFVPNIAAIGGFFALALVSWLAARSLEQALQELRTTNRELDQRVALRTHDLAQALDRVQAESSKNQAILESIADGVIVFDNDSKPSVANISITPLLGYDPNEVAGHTIESMIEQKMSANDQQTFIDLLKAGVREPSVKFQWNSKTLSVSFAPVYISPEQKSGTVVVFRDFTREAELDRMKSAFVSMASHELRTPLNAILGYADMVKEGVFGPLNDEQNTAMERVVINAKRMLSLVNNLLDQAQIEAGRLSLRMAPFQLTDLLKELDAVMSILAESKGLKFICEVAEGVPPVVMGDAQRLNQILINLVGNAVKFTDEGHVKVRVTRPDEQNWVLEVIDTGPGIPKEAQGYVFEAFRQVDDPITRRHTGSGLGLAIVKQLANLMGGDVILTSEVGHGSTFTITLPLAPVQEEVIS